MESLKMRGAAAGERVRGYTAKRASVYSAIGTVAQGLYEYSQSKT
jgi:hypothetical protein